MFLNYSFPIVLSAFFSVHKSFVFPAIKVDSSHCFGFLSILKLTSILYTFLSYFSAINNIGQINSNNNTYIVQICCCYRCRWPIRKTRKILKQAFLESSASILVNVHMLYYDCIKIITIFDCQNDKNDKMRIRRYDEHFEQLWSPATRLVFLPQYWKILFWNLQLNYKLMPICFIMRV